MADYDREMQAALEADGEKLRQLTGEDHGPWYFVDCPNCGGTGIIAHGITIYEGGGSYRDTDERPCPECGGTAIEETTWEPDYVHCSMGVGCDEVGVCYAEAHNQPEQCPSHPRRKPAS
jgi:predicted nucleic-acid-binding Zn-ribbon protein